MIVSDHGTEFTSNAMLGWTSEAIGGATPTSSADRPLLHRRYHAILTEGP